MTTEERLEKLELELAGLKAGLATRVQTRLVEVVDENGNVRAVLTASKIGPGLRLLDDNGKTRVGLIVGKGEPVLALCDENATGRAVFNVGKEGAALSVLDAAGQLIWKAP